MEREVLRQMEGVRGAMEKRNGARGDWEVLGRGRRCQWERERQREPSSCSPLQGQLAAVQGSPGISWSRDTPSGNTRLVPSGSFQVTKDLPTCLQEAGNKCPTAKGASRPDPLLHPATTSLWTAHPWRIGSYQEPGWDHPSQTLVPRVPSGPGATATLQVTGTRASRKTENLHPSCWI